MSLKVMCDKCNKEVDKVVMSYHPFHKDTETGVYLFTAHCHNEVDRTMIPEDLFDKGWKIVKALAFRQNKNVDSEPTPICLPDNSEPEEKPVTVPVPDIIQAAVSGPFI